MSLAEGSKRNQQTGDGPSICFDEMANDRNRTNSEQLCALIRSYTPLKARYARTQK
jgi:hypothetical protein